MRTLSWSTLAYGLCRVFLIIQRAASCRWCCTDTDPTLTSSSAPPTHRVCPYHSTPTVGRVVGYISYPMALSRSLALALKPSVWLHWSISTTVISPPPGTYLSCDIIASCRRPQFISADANFMICLVVYVHIIRHVHKQLAGGRQLFNFLNFSLAHKTSNHTLCGTNPPSLGPSWFFLPHQNSVPLLSNLSDRSCVPQYIINQGKSSYTNVPVWNIARPYVCLFFWRCDAWHPLPQCSWDTVNNVGIQQLSPSDLMCQNLPRTEHPLKPSFSRSPLAQGVNRVRMKRSQRRSSITVLSMWPHKKKEVLHVWNIELVKTPISRRWQQGQRFRAIFHKVWDKN